MSVLTLADTKLKLTARRMGLLNSGPNHHCVVLRTIHSFANAKKDMMFKCGDGGSGTRAKLGRCRL